MTARPHRIRVLLFPGVTLLDVAGPAEVFSEANRYGAHYEVVTYSRDGRPVRSSTGIQLAVDAAADTATPKVSVRTSASGLASLIGSPLHGPTSSRIRSSA